MPEAECERGSEEMKNNVASDTGMKHDEEVCSPSAKNISESRLYRSVRIRSYGTVGYGPTMWVKSKKALTFCTVMMARQVRG